MNALADNGEFKKITERINGGTNGLLARIERLDAAKNALAV